MLKTQRCRPWYPGAVCSAVVSLALSGCVATERVGVPVPQVRVEEQVVAPHAPPPPRAELPPPVPGEHYVWRPGHWWWNGQTYAWVAGEYVERPNPRAAWVGGHWAERGPNWVWVPGHWS